MPFKSSGKYFLVLFIIAIVVFLVVLFWPQAAVSNESFGQCLANSNVVMYGADSCENCSNQKALFGEDFKHVAYVNCEFNLSECQNKGIHYYPLWSKENEVLIGLQSLEELSNFSGCDL